MHKWIRYFLPRDDLDLTSSLLIQLCCLSAMLPITYCDKRCVKKPVDMKRSFGYYNLKDKTLVNNQGVIERCLNRSFIFIFCKSENSNIGLYIYAGCWVCVL